MRIDPLTAFIVNEARELVRDLERNTSSPTPVMLMLGASKEFASEDDFGPAACVIDTLYTISGRDQDFLEDLLEAFEDEATLIGTFHNAIVCAMEEIFEERTGESLFGDSDDGCCCCDECSVKFRDMHTPNTNSEEDGPVSLFEAVMSMQQQDDDDTPGDCDCPECRAEREEAAAIEAANFLRSKGFTIFKAVRGGNSDN